MQHPDDETDPPTPPRRANIQSVVRALLRACIVFGALDSAALPLVDSVFVTVPGAAIVTIHGFTLFFIAIELAWAGGWFGPTRSVETPAPRTSTEETRTS